MPSSLVTTMGSPVINWVAPWYVQVSVAYTAELVEPATTTPCPGGGPSGTVGPSVTGDVQLEPPSAGFIADAIALIPAGWLSAGPFDVQAQSQALASTWICLPCEIGGCTFGGTGSTVAIKTPGGAIETDLLTGAPLSASNTSNFAGVSGRIVDTATVAPEIAVYATLASPNHALWRVFVAFGAIYPESSGDTPPTPPPPDPPPPPTPYPITSVPYDPPAPAPAAPCPALSF